VAEERDDPPRDEAPAREPEATPDDDEPTEVADDEVTDSLPEDLDVSGYVGPYLFPNNNRRRIPGYIYLGVAAGCIVAWFAGGNDHPWVNEGLLWAAVILIAAGTYCIASGYDLDVDEQDALVAATRSVGFPVGHASAQMGWRGLRSRPTWRILCYSAENPPERRALVLVDGVDGEVIDFFVEDNPEDWSDLDGELTGSGVPFRTGE
jgi:hypothetical protein